MSGAADLIRAEAAALWMEIFGEPPAPDADGGLLLAAALERMEVKDYTRLTAAERAHDLTWPKRPAD